MSPRFRGTALITVMMAMVVLATMLEALIIVAHGRAGESLVYYQHAATECMVEAAVARVQDELDNNPNFAPSSLTDGLDQMEGSYTVNFSPLGAGSAGQSTNNLSGSSLADGPRGPQTVPAGYVDLVVNVQVNGTTRQEEVLLTGVSGDIPPYGLTASGHVRLRGNISVQGTTTSSSGTVLPAGIHSNLSDPSVSDAISWSPLQPSDRAVVTGNVSVSSPSHSAIDFGSNPSAYTVGGFNTGTPTTPLPLVDIPGQIQANSSAPDPAVSAMGSSQISQSKSYHAGNLQVNGDLQLVNATLYVSGNLTVNGSISGNGSVYVGGGTQFKGKAAISADNTSSVAVYSQGSVQLTGFDGLMYLQSVAASNPQIAALYATVQQDQNSLTNFMQQNVPGYDPYSSSYLAQLPSLPVFQQPVGPQTVQLFANLENSMVGNGGQSGYHGPQHGPPPPPGPPEGNGALNQLGTLLATCPSSSARDFVIVQLDALANDWSDMQANNGQMGGMLSHWIQSSGEFASISQMSLDGLGQSYFQGLVHTKGYLYASNTVHIIGSVWAQDDGSQRSGIIPSGDSIDPGDLFLDDGVSLALSQQYTQQQNVNLGSGTGKTRVTAWLQP